MAERTSFYEQHSVDGCHKPLFCSSGFVLSCTLLTPPIDPEEEDAYVVPAGATDGWSGHEKQIALWRGGIWLFIEPRDGGRVFCLAEKECHTFKNNNWYPDKQRFSLSSLADQAIWEITHSTDEFFKRIVQVYYDKLETDASLDFDEVDEGQFIQEDSTKTSFEGDSLHISHGAFSPYTHWHLNEATGATVLDSSGNGRDGTPANSPVSVAGKLNSCLSFNGVNQYVNCDNIAGFERSELFSFEAWIKTSAGVTQVIFSKWVYYRGWMFYLSAGGKVQFLLANSTGNRGYITGSDILNDDAWHHVVVTYDGSSNMSGVKIYVDSILDAAPVIGDNNLTATILNSGNCQISGRAGAEFSFNGLIDEALIYDKVLTQEEIISRWNGGAGREDVGYPIGNWYVLTNTNQLNTSGWDAIKSIAFGQTEPANTQLRYLLSVDGRDTWNKWNGAAWVSEVLANIHTNGNTQAELEALTAVQWALFFTPGTLDIAIGLKTTAEDATPDLDLITIQFSLPGKYKCKETQIDIILDSATMTKVKNISGGVLEDLGAVVSV